MCVRRFCAVVWCGAGGSVDDSAAQIGTSAIFVAQNEAGRVRGGGADLIDRHASGRPGRHILVAMLGGFGSGLAPWSGDDRVGFCRADGRLEQANDFTGLFGGHGQGRCSL